MLTSRLSPFDRSLLALLRLNARLKITEIANKLNASRVRVSDRINYLVDIGVIKRFTIETESPFLNEPDLIGFFYILKLNKNSCNKMFDYIKDLPEIKRAWSISGEYDMLIHAQSHDPGEIDRIRDKLYESKLVQEVVTSINLKTWKESS